MLSLNWFDYLIIAILLFYAYEGYSSGFIRALLDLINFVLSFLVGLRFYSFFAGFLIDKFSIPQGFSDAIGFFVATFLTEIIFGMLIRKYLTLPRTTTPRSSERGFGGNTRSEASNAPTVRSWVRGLQPSILNKLNKILGILPGILSGVILISFILILVIALPAPTPIKRSISSSKISSLLLSNAQGLEKELNLVFGGAISETINFLTVEPKGNEIVSLNFKTKKFSPDLIAEHYMFSLVNKERSARGLRELVFDGELTDVGRNHCKDMFERGYFSHYTLEGLSPFDRMDGIGIVYNAAGENLALSPNTDIAMKGLMNSPGHKANILSSDFGRVGVGVIDGGIYGEMFCQEFTN